MQEETGRLIGMWQNDVPCSNIIAGYTSLSTPKARRGYETPRPPVSTDRTWICMEANRIGGSSVKRKRLLVMRRLTLFLLGATFTLGVLSGCATQSGFTALSSNDAALQTAAFKGDLGEVQALIENKADVNAANRDGTTPLFMAAQGGHREIIALLLDHGADAKQARKNDSVSPLYIAAQQGHREIVALLLDHGADAKQARKNDGVSPLYIAAQQGHREIVMLLLDHGADTKQGTTNGRTALHVAAFHGHREIVTLLLKYGAEKSAKATTGQRPVDFARQQGHSALVPLLEP